MSLFDYEIAYHCISTPKKHSKAMALIDSDKTKTDAAFEFICAQSSRVLGLDTAGRNRKVETPIKFQQYQILNSCAREIQRLLSSCYISLESNNQAIQPSDIAILVRSSNQAKMVKRVFDEYGLATVALSEKALLFQSKEAANLACLLEAIQHPSKNSIRLALTTGLLCSSAPQNNRSNTNKDENGTGDINITDQLLQNEMHPQWEFVYQRITELATLWKDKNVHALLQEVVQGIDFEGTHLANANNVERSLTNYLHLAEILGAAEIVQRAPLQLLYWLKQQIHAPEKNDASQLRLESDQKLIKIITQHKSKGLEYPIVFLPFANHYYASPNGQYLSFHDKNNQSVEQLGKTLEADRYATKEQLAEDMRLLYVSLTRPILRCYLGIAGSLSANNSALQRALGITIDSKEEYENLGQWMQQQLQHSLKNLGGIVNCVQATTLDHKESKVNWITQKEQVELGQVLTMARYIDDSWQVTSFSRLANAFEASRPSARFRHESVANISLTSPLLSEHQIETSRDTEELQLQSNHYSSYSQNTNQISHRSASKLEIACYAFTFPKGPDAGNFLHDLLEALNFDELKDMQKSGDELKTLAQQLGVLQVNREKIDFARLYDWFETILSTPLNNDDTLLLGHLLANQVLKESEFYFPIESVDIRAIAKFVDRYRRRLLNINASTEANSQGQNQAINDAMLIEFSKQIKGAMHGFIDLIFEFNGQYFVCDYKSNFLGLELQDYGRTILTEDIIHHHYDLQYLIYSLALHRYLQHKVPDYSYEKHVGGVYYLYLRGMNGVNNQSGVYFDKLPLSSIQALDTLFSCIKQSSELE